METWYEVYETAAGLPAGTTQAQVYARAVELADASGDLDAAVECRVAHIEACRDTDRVPAALDDLERCLGLADAEPARYAEFADALAGSRLWLVGAARRFPGIALDRIEALIEGLDPRPALGARLDLKLATGHGRPLDALLDDWRAAARAGIGCPACDLLLEVRALLALDRADEALAAVGPFFRGEVAACAEGPAPLGTLVVEPLLAAGRPRDAGEVFRLALRAGRGRVDRTGELAQLAALCARTADGTGARRLAGQVLGQLDRVPDPETRRLVLAHLARVVGDPPPGTDAEAHPLSLARALAADFTERDGTDLASRSTEAAAHAPELPAVSLRIPPAPIEVDPDRILEEIEPLPRPEPAGDDPVEAPVDRGGEAFHDWAFAEMDRWQLQTVRDAAGRLWLDPDADLGVRAAAGLWLGATGDGPDAEELTIALDAGGDALPPGISASVRAEAAAGHVQAERPGPAATLAAEALDLLDGAGDAVGVRTATSALRSLVDVFGRLGDGDRLRRTLGLLHRRDPGAESGDPAAVLVALTDLAVAEQEAARSTDEEHLDRLRLAAERVGLAAESVLDAQPHPLAAHALVEVARRRMALGEADAAARHLRLASRAVPAGLASAPLRLNLHLMLADALMEVGGPAAGLPAQRAALDAAREIGLPSLVGWARRGLAHQLLALGRIDDAAVQFAEAVDRLEAGGGDPDEVLRLRLALARARVVQGRAVEAGDLAASVLDAVEARTDLAPEVLDELVVQALDVGADAAFADDDAAAAEADLTRLADRLAVSGRPAALARSNAARAAARAGALDRAEALFDQATEELAATPEADRAHAEAVVLGRRGEVAWWADRNDEAAAHAQQALGLAASSGDELLAARLGALVARARHDQVRLVLRTNGQGTARRLLPEAERALVEAIQAARAIDDDAAGAELEGRLDELRDALP